MGIPVREIEQTMTPTDLLEYRIYLNQDYWQKRVSAETDEGRSMMIDKLLMG